MFVFPRVTASHAVWTVVAIPAGSVRSVPVVAPKDNAVVSPLAMEKRAEPMDAVSVAAFVLRASNATALERVNACPIAATKIAATMVVVGLVGRAPPEKIVPLAFVHPAAKTVVSGCVPNPKRRAANVTPPVGTWVTVAPISATRAVPSSVVNAPGHSRG